MSEVIVETTKLSEKGQVVIPKEVRVRLGLTLGSKFLVLATRDSIVLQKVELAGERLRARDLIERAKAIAQRLGFS